MPPSALLDEATVEEAEDEVAVAVELENGATAADKALVTVAVGASTNTVPVESVQALSDEACVCVTATATMPVAEVAEVAEMETVLSAITEPVTTVAVTGTVTVPVTVEGAGGALALNATAPHSTCWFVHSSNENPGPEKLTHASY